MITVKLKGGLGNQMFQYAYGRSLSLDKNDSLKLDLGNIIYPSKHDTPRAYGLDKFNIQATLYIPKNNYFIKRFFSKILGKIWKKESYFHSEKYFRNNAKIIVNDFKLKNPPRNTSSETAFVIKASISPVSIHIRRGDYVNDSKTNTYHGVIDIDYYERAINYIKKYYKDSNFFIFSDDIEWVKKNLNIQSDTVLVSRPEIPDYEELFLMSLCKHNIIANSSFSWWGAWLNQNPDKIVIAPKRWFRDKSIDTTDICPPEWIRL